MKIVLDTSFLQSYLNKKDSNYKNSRLIFRQLHDDTEFIIPIVAVGELLCGVKEEEPALKLMDGLTDNHYELNTKLDIEFIKKMDSSLRRNLKANDCFILAICNRERAELLTFDKKLQKAYDALIN